MTDVAQLVVSVTGDTASLQAALARGEASTKAFAASATASANEATAAMKGVDQTVTQTMRSVQKLGDETVKLTTTTRQHGQAVTSTATTVRTLGDEITKTTVQTRNAEAAAASLTSRLQALGNLGAVLRLPGAQLATQAAAAAQGLDGLVGAEGGVTAGLTAMSPVLLGAGAAVAALGLAAVAAGKQAEAFQTQLSRAQANTTMTTEQVKAMGAAILQMSSESGASLADLGAGYVHIANIMGDAADAAKVLDVAQQSAVSTGGSVAEYAQTLARVLHEFGMSGAEAASAMDMLHTAAAAGDLTLEQFTANSGTALAAAANYGVKLDQVTAAYIALTKHGMDAAEANTQISDGLLRLTQVTPKVATELQRVSQLTGVDLVGDFTSAGLATKGYTGILADLRQAYTDMGLTTEQATAESMLLGDALKGGRGLAILAGNGYADYQATLAQVDDTTASAAKRQDDYNRYLQTTAGEIDQLKGKLAALAVTVGGPVNDAFGAVLGVVNTDITAVGELAGAIEGLGARAVTALAPAIAALQQVAGGAVATAKQTLGDVGGGAGARAGNAIGGAVNAVATAAGGPDDLKKLLVPFVGVALEIQDQIGRHVQANQAAADKIAGSGYQGDPAQVAADHENHDIDPAAALAAAQATRGAAAQATQAKAAADSIDAMVKQVTDRHATLSSQLANVKAGFAATIDPMRAKVDSAQQSYDEAGLQATVATDQVHDQYDQPIKDAQAALTAFQQQHTRAQAQFAQEAADAHAAHDDTIHQLQQQIQLMTDANKYERERVQLTDQIAQAQAQIAMQAALGDPAKRAADEGAIAGAQAAGAVAAAHERVQALTYQLQRTPDNARNHDVYVQAKAALDEATARLAEAQLVNPAALGAATTQGAVAGSKASADSTAAAIATATTQLAEIPLQQKLDAEQAALQAQLDTIQQQKDAEDALYTKTLPGLQAALDLVKGKEQDALDRITAQLRTKQEIVDQIKADLIPQIDAQTAAEKLAEAPIDAQLTQIASVEAAWKTAKDNVDAYNKALTEGGPDAALAVARAQAAAMSAADAASEGPDYHGLSGAVGGQAGPNPPGTVSVVAGASFAAQAESRIGENLRDYCEKFVEQVTGSDRHFATAVQAAANLDLTGGNPLDAPVGSVLYYANLGKDGQLLQASQDAQGNWQNAGHAAIKEAGNVQIGSDDNGVSKEIIGPWATQNHQQYLGFYVPPAAADYGHGGGSNAGASAPGGSGNVTITVADGAIRIDGAAAGQGQQLTRLLHDSLEQLARDVAATITPGAPRNVPGNVHA